MNPTDLKDLLSGDRGKAILDFLYTTRGKKILVVGLIVMAFAIGHYWPSGDETKPAATQTGVSVADQHDHDADKPAKDAKKPALWTCAMHPQIKLPHPGKCPICFMDLVPLETGGGQSDVSLTQYAMSNAAKKLAEVETAEAKRGTGQRNSPNGRDGRRSRAQGRCPCVSSRWSARRDLH